MLNKGIHQIAENIYHADCAPVPSLSNSIAKVLLKQSPLHAFMQHPRLNQNYEGENDKKFDVGTAAHALLLEGKDKMVVCEFNDWRTSTAKEQRDLAYLENKIPVLGHQYQDVYLMAESAKKAIENCEDLGGVTLNDGKSEQTLVWQENANWMRARLDWLHNDHNLILDYKTTDILNPESWMRSIVSNGYEMQDSFYRRGIRNITGKDAKFVFIVQEASAPYACYFVSLPPAYQALGDDKIEEAIKLWSQCMRTSEWPAYTNRIMYPDLKPWQESEWIEKKMQEPAESSMTQRIKSGEFGIAL